MAEPYSREFFRECGRKGGLKKSDAKLLAIRENAKKARRAHRKNRKPVIEQ